MKSLFPSHLISGSVKNQTQLNAAFSQYPNYPKEFLTIALAKTDIRNWYEKNWLRVYKYLDKNFAVEFQGNNHRNRAWEFHIGVTLLERGFVLQEIPDIGPDFCIKCPDGKIWIEAIACDLGIVDSVAPMPDMVSGVMYSFGGNIEDINRSRILRITNAITTKFAVYKNYLKNPRSGVRQNECFIIAVNGSAIQHHSSPEILFPRAVFAKGPDTYKFNKDKQKFRGPFYQPKETTIKKTDEKEELIPTNLMALEDFSEISAVVYSGNSAYNSWLNNYQLGDDFLFAYHSTPLNPIPDGFFKSGTEIRKNIQDGTIFTKKY